MDRSGIFSVLRRRSITENINLCSSALLPAYGCWTHRRLAADDTRLIPSSIQIVNSFLHICVDGVIRLGEVARIEQGLAHMTGLIAADGTGENGHAVLI